MEICVYCALIEKKVRPHEKRTNRTTEIVRFHLVCREIIFMCFFCPAIQDKFAGRINWKAAAALCFISRKQSYAFSTQTSARNICFNRDFFFFFTKYHVKGRKWRAAHFTHSSTVWFHWSEVPQMKESPCMRKPNEMQIWYLVMAWNVSPLFYSYFVFGEREDCCYFVGMVRRAESFWLSNKEDTEH